MMILTLHAITSFMMLAIVLGAHFVQYPLLRAVPEHARASFESEYTRRAGRLIAPTMLVEFSTGALLALSAGFALNALLVNFALICAVWGVTFFWSVPQHGKLEKAWNDGAHRSLMRSNAVRVMLWIAHCAIVAIELPQS